MRADTGRSHGRGLRVRAAAWTLVALAAVLGAFASSASASAATAVKKVTYHGYTIRVPVTWPVYRLGGGSTACVRFNRHAVYLGAPSAGQRCPASALGRTEAILVAPQSASRAVLPAAGSETQRTLASRRLVVTATWNRDPAVIRRALGGRLTPPKAPAPALVPVVRTAEARAASRPHAAGAVYNGLGFDACSAPSTTAMAAWGASPYRAIGVYIGGINMACSQTNLTSTWVAQQSAAGWSLVPTYVSLQAPSNSCGCSAMSTNTSTASTQGAAAAQAAVTDAQAIGIGAGNPIYDDMESYSRTSTNTAAVLAFLSAWTTQLHAEGYVSGVYGGAESGMVDLSNQVGTTYPEPDDIWIADWNGSQTTSDPYVPAADWADNQRLHQYEGGHNETYGGVKINIDNDYLGGATAFGAAVATPPSLKVSPATNGAVRVAASWQGGIGLSSWLILGGTQPTSLSYVSQSRVKGALTTINEGSAYPYYEAEALGSAGQVLATSATVTTGPHLALYGHSIFVPAKGLAGVPAGCFTGAPCRVALQIFVGRRRIAHSNPEPLSSSSGLLFFTLSPADRRLLAGVRGRLPVTVVAKDVSGTAVSASMHLVSFTTAGRGPRRSLSPAPTMRVIGTSDFVFGRLTGGILAGCGASPCQIATKITSGRTTIATTGPEFIGANVAAYLSFKLTAAGRALLAHATGNMLGARVTLTDGAVAAHASISLSSYF